MAMAHLRCGAIAEALRAADALIALSREQGFATWLAHGMICRAAALSWVEPPAKAIPLLKDAIAECLATGNLIFNPVQSLELVGAYLRAGKVETGLALVAELLANIERTGERQGEAPLRCVRGQLLLAGPNPDENEAEASLQMALAVARRQRFKLAELVAATGLARLWRQQGKQGAALELLAPIYGWFTEGFEFPVLRDARALLCELSKP